MDSMFPKKKKAKCSKFPALVVSLIEYNNCKNMKINCSTIENTILESLF